MEDLERRGGWRSEKVVDIEEVRAGELMSLLRKTNRILILSKDVEYEWEE